MKRWIAYVYTLDSMEPVHEWAFDEISELHELVEQTDWDDIDQIVIEYQGGDDE